MLFSSPVFLFLFLPFFLLSYYLLPNRWRNLFLFIASLFFYAWGEREIVLVLLVSASLNFVAGLLIEKGHKRTGMTLSLIGSLSLLAYFKYANFLTDLALGVTQLVDPQANFSIATVFLPIGISFYTFQGISYAYDVYRGHIPADHSFVRFGTYLAMFPHQIAGPIVRYADIAPELHERHTSLDSFGKGAERFILGLVKKMLLANTFAAVADQIFAAPLSGIDTATAWLGIVAYSLQIYLDFSAYSDMAIGLGKMIGFDFKENFNYPYIASSVTDFWRRWHISLSTWFRDYLYIPLGGNRGSNLQTYRNLLLVFFVTGLWHGASWNFIVWGLYHGFFLLVERAGLNQWLQRTSAAVARAYTLLVVLIGWVFFRATDLPAAIHYLQKMMGLLPTLQPVYWLRSFTSVEFIVTLLLGVLVCAPVHLIIKREWQKLAGLSWLRPTASIFYVVCLMALFMLSAMYLAAGTYNPFIYFRF